MYDRVRRALIGVALATLCGLSLLSAATQSLAQTTVRMGHFPNITHVQALVAHNMSRHGKGWFEQRLGPDVKIEWYVYNAGPSAMEAIFAKSIDATYVGPNPAINAYVRSRGQEILKWFDTSAFTLNPIGTVGNSGINIVRGPALSNFDLAMFKKFQFKERFKLQFRAEFFNTLNHTVLGNPNATFADGNFGKILGTQTAPRVGEMGLKLLF